MKSDFEERKARKLETFQRLAIKNEQESESSYEYARKIGDAIPFGQPILVGHHSERGHRAHLKKIDNAMRKSVEADKKAAYYEAKAENLLNGTAISSDDPNAIDKLQEKLEGLEKSQELFKQINKIIRKKASDIEKTEALKAIGLKEETAIKLLTPDPRYPYCNMVGIPSYKLTNNNANIKRVKDRIKHLESVAAVPESEEMYGDVKLKINPDDNRVQIFFPGIPAEEVRKSLKMRGFHWSPSVKAWQRQISNGAIYWAKDILSKLPAA